MGKSRRRLTSPKFAKKYANLRAAIARRKGEVEPEPAPIVEEVVIVAKPEPVVTAPVPAVIKSEPVVTAPVPKATKKAPTKRKTTTKRTTTKKPTTKRTKRSSVKKDK